jgi:hypothetical protein
MNWAYILSAIGLEIALLTLVYNLTASRFKTHNKWLREQLDLAKENSSDNLVKVFSERAKMLEEEVKRLALDRESNQAEIKEKEGEIEHNKKIAAQIKAVAEEVKSRYDELKKKVDVCPYCEAALVELKDIHDEDWTGSHRKYDCGFTMLDGDTILLCPHDPMYPKFEQLKLKTEYDEERKRWTCRYSDTTMKTWRLPMTVTHGKTEREATYLMQICHEGRLDNEAPTDSAF